MENKYVIIDIRTMDFMKDDDGKIVFYDDENEACRVCGMYEFEDVWVMKLVHHYVDEVERLRYLSNSKRSTKKNS
jgi:hypothetical protein